MADPGQKLAYLDRAIGITERADAETSNTQAVLVRIEPPNCLAKDFRYAVTAVRSGDDRIVDEAFAPMKADCVV